MRKLSRALRVIARQAASFEGRVIDVSADGRATVQISKNGPVYRMLNVVGGPVSIGQTVHVDFTTPTPHIVAPGVSQVAAAASKLKPSRVISIPVETTTPTFWNPFPSDEVFSVKNMNNGFGSNIDTSAIGNSPTYTQHTVTSASLPPSKVCGYGNYIYLIPTGANEWDYYRINIVTGEAKIWSVTPGSTLFTRSLVIDNNGRVYMLQGWPRQLLRANFDTGGREVLAQFPTAYPFGDLVYVDHYVVAVEKFDMGPTAVRWIAYDVNTETWVSNTVDIEQDTGPGMDNIEDMLSAPIAGKVAIRLLKADNVSGDYFATCIVIDPANNSLAGPHDLVSMPSFEGWEFYSTSGSSAGYFRTSGPDRITKVTSDCDIISDYTTPGPMATCDGDAYIATQSGDVISWLKLSDLSNAGSLTIASGYTAKISTEASENGDLWVSAHNGSGSYFYRHNLKTGSNSNVTGLPSLYTVNWIHQIGDRVIIFGTTATDDVVIVVPGV